MSRGTVPIVSKAGVNPEFLPVLLHVARLQAQHGRSPLLREVVIDAPVPMRTAYHRLYKFAEGGYVTIEGTKSSRAVTLTAHGRAALGLQPEPRLLAIGRVALETPMAVNAARCGPLTETASEPVFLVETLTDLFHSFRVGDQLLVAVGDSMELAGDDESISDGDRCLLRPGIWPGKGELVFVEYELPNGLRECTLKMWNHDERSHLVTLKAKNPAYADIVKADDEIIVRGVVLEVLRQLKRRK